MSLPDTQSPEDKFLKLRSEIRLDLSHVYLAAFWLSSHPKPVRRAIARFRSLLDRNPYLYMANHWERNDERARESIAKFIGGSAANVALTENTSEGLNLIFNGLGLSASSDIVSTVHEHYSAYKGLDEMAYRNKVRINRVTLYDDKIQADATSMVERLVGAVTDATRLVVVTWVHSSTGVKLPVEAIARALEQLNGGRPSRKQVLLCVDAAHAFGAMPINLGLLPNTFVVSSCHKWLMGPRGTAFVYGDKEALTATSPVIPSFSDASMAGFLGRKSNVDADHLGRHLTPGGFVCFEHRWAVPSAIHMIMDLDIHEIEKRLSEFVQILKTAVQMNQNLKLITPLDPAISGPLVCFIKHRTSSDLVVGTLLDMGVIASATPYAESFVRLSPGVFNTREEILTACRCIELL